MAMYNPPHPGEFIKETYLEPLNISLRTAAFKLTLVLRLFLGLLKERQIFRPNGIKIK